LAGGTLLEGRV